MAKKQQEHPSVAFLRTLYQGTSGEGVVELRAIHNSSKQVTQIWATSATEIVEFAEQFDKASNTSVYFGVCKRKQSGGSKKADVWGATALWADVDTVSMGWDTEACLKAIHELRGVLQPSAVVRSGGGLHLYWFLSDPEHFGGMQPANTKFDSAKQIEDANKVMADLVSGDNVHDVTRILRLPGTFNTKRGMGKASKCEVVYCWGHARKDVHELLHEALSFGKVLFNGKWLPRKQAEAAMCSPLAPASDQVEFAKKLADLQGNRNTEKSLRNMWETRVRYHAGRGYIGIDEAVLLSTARLHCAKKPDDFIVTLILGHIRNIKMRDAPSEKWDMAAERKSIEAKLARWKPQWQAINNGKQRGQAERRGASVPDHNGRKRNAR